MKWILIFLSISGPLHGATVKLLKGQKIVLELDAEELEEYSEGDSVVVTNEDTGNQIKAEFTRINEVKKLGVIRIIEGETDFKVGKSAGISYKENSYAKPSRKIESDERSYQDGKVLGINAKLGIFIGAGAGAGLNIFYPYSRNWHIGLNLMSGATVLDKDTVEGVDKDEVDSEAKFSSSIFNVEARYFVTETFYLNFGLGRQSFQWEITIEEEESASQKITTEGDVVNTVAMFSIGNIWRFKSGFFIGADWIGISSPISRGSINSDSEIEGSLSSEAVDVHDKYNDQIRDTVKVASLLFVIGNFGWVF